MKPLADSLWTLVRWTLPMAAAAVVVVLALGSHRISEEIRRRVEAVLRERLPGVAVTVGGASLVEGQGIVVRELTLAADGRNLATVEEVHLACPATLAELVAGEPRITAVRLRRPVVQARRTEAGGWDVAVLLRSRGAGLGVPVDVEAATLVIEDPRIGGRISLHDVGVALQPGTSPDGGRRTSIRGDVGGDLFERAEFTGHLDESGGFTLAGRVAALELSPRLRGLWPAADTADWGAGLRGRVDLEWSATGTTAAMEKTQLAVTGRLEGGRFEHAALPLAVNDIAASFTADASGVACERFEGHSGSTLLRGSGRLAGWNAAADFDVVLEAERLLVGRHWEAFLPASLAGHWSKLLPAGEVDVRTRLVRRAGRITPEASVRCRNVSLTHYRFPYRLDRTVGTATLAGGKLSLHLTGSAGGHPVHVSAAIDTASGGAPGSVEVRGEGMRIDEALLEALPPRSADIVRRLRASGTFDFAFRHERDPRFERGFSNSLGIRLTGCTMAYAGFPYPLSNVSGSVRMQEGRWTIRDVTGTNDTGVVTCNGSLEPAGDREGELTLHLAGSDVVLERELRDALPPGMQRIWDDVDPRGNAEFKAVVRHHVASRRTEVELEATPQGDTVSIEPAWFPYRLERLRGRLAWKDGCLRFEGVRGVHDRTVVSTEGSCRFSPDGGWHVSFERLTADRFRADHEVLRALPAGLQQAVADTRLKGLLSVDGAVEIYSTAPRETRLADGRSELVPGPAAAAWDVQLDLEQATLELGAVLQHVHGGIRLKGASDGRVWRSLGDVAIDSAMCRGVQLTGVRGPLAIDASGARFGAPAAAVAEPGSPRHLSARLAGGTLLLDGTVSSGENGGFAIAASLADADLARLAADVGGGPATTRGRVQAGLEVRGSRSGTHSLTGHGQVRLRDADLYELPVIVALLKILRVKAPDRTAFGSSLVEFRIEGPRAYLDTIELSGDAISLVGAGEVDLDSNVSLTFRPLMGKAETQLPAMKRLLGGAGGQFMLVHVGGTLADPVMTTEAFPTLPAAVERLQSQRRQPAGDRTAGGREPPR